MKVISPGALVFANGVLVVQGWAFESTGVRFSDPAAERRAVLAAALQFIAERYQVDAGGTSDQVPADVERMTLDAIAVARWREHPGA